jgi:hypothetical protein
MIHRMHARSQCPSELFADMDIGKVFMTATDDSERSEDKSEKEKKLPRSHVISLRHQPVRKVFRGSS